VIFRPYQTVDHADLHADGLSGIFWLFLNRGQYGASWKKMILTVVNLVIVGIGACLVRRIFQCWAIDDVTNCYEVWHGSLGVWEGNSR
jgi:hypothetical protein